MPEVKSENRLKYLDITPELFLAVCQGGDRPYRIKVTDGVPDSAKIVDVEYLRVLDYIRLTLQDDSFDEVTVGQKPSALSPKFTRIEDEIVVSVPIARGDVVELRSGGPRMAVSRVVGDVASCVWMPGDPQPVGRGDFDVACLKKVG